MESNGSQPQPKKSKSVKIGATFDDNYHDNVNEIKSIEDVEGNREEEEDIEDDEQSLEMRQKKKKKSFFGRFSSWFGRKKEIIRAKTMKYGARLTKNKRRDDVVKDQGNISLALGMVMMNGKEEPNQKS